MDSSAWLSVHQSPALVITTTAVATATLLLLAQWTLLPRWPRVMLNPLKTTASRKAGQKKGLATGDAKGDDDDDDAEGGEFKNLVYHPEALPGGRNVDTPYGTIRVYEFGPEDGDKVLMVHGISTPCLTLYGLATRLAERGSRVMLFDLFGRGFSDGVGDLPHDARLYVSQMLLALASSPLSWTGTNSVSLVGYSLGGAIAIHFAVSFPHMVSSLVLLAPAGLIRSESFGLPSRILFRSCLVPERILAHLARVRLQKPIAGSVKPKRVAASIASPEPVEVAEAVHLTRADDADDVPLPLEKRVMSYVRWMVANHEGFIPAFMSSIKHAPMIDQHDSWRLLARRDPGSTLILLAEDDEIIDLDIYRRDAVALAGGPDRVDLRVMPGTHDFVMTHTDKLFEEMDQWWAAGRKS
ncbi:Uncharacterized protein ESCO_000752 [Escovopsis weberi]|uniref:Serine aminopeptidase S33 domain-containing protein n=1 Tax=Escovopsis weberi TaxID=150374 RepID=A0A0M8N2Y9_ESCWE|nr:Uncharacterized protein ESCO_000752 [Escovopsis weberi]